MTPTYIVFVVETDASAQSDDQYINFLLKKYGLLEPTERTYLQWDFVHLGGKGNYKSKNAMESIEASKKRSSAKRKIVIFCFDVDKSKKDNQAIIKYCASLPYENEIIWFCKAIEPVFLGKSVEKKDKKNEAITFYMKGKLSNVIATLLRLTKDGKPSSLRQGESNVLRVLSKCLPLSLEFKSAIQKCIKKNDELANGASNGKRRKGK